MSYAVAILVLVFLFYLFPVVRVCGLSMFPTLNDGQYLFSIRLLIKKDKCEVGEIYVYKPPYESDEEKYVIKRLAHIEYDRDNSPMYYFLGDNSDDSYDSRYYGYVDYRNVVAYIPRRKER